MNRTSYLCDPDHRMHIPTPDVDPDPPRPPDTDPDTVPPDGAPRPIGDPPDRSPPEHVRQHFVS